MILRSDGTVVVKIKALHYSLSAPSPIIIDNASAAGLVHYTNNVLNIIFIDHSGPTMTVKLEVDLFNNIALSDISLSDMVGSFWSNSNIPVYSAAYLLYAYDLFDIVWRIDKKNDNTIEHKWTCRRTPCNI